jgi:vitamin-K-epoxide reductase (warfarin-sensitive)
VRYVIAVLGVAGIVVSCLALAGRYDQPVQPIEILHSHWNSSYVNQSSYAEVYGIPVAVLGIAGYALLVALALLHRTALMAYWAGIAIVYTLHVTNIEAQILQVWCVYHVCSLILIVLITFLVFGMLIFESRPVTTGHATGSQTK